ncbi:hypothetical protein NE237_021849 [Protea cynaroides]|uniref:Uncharacterized protein n=1 Tax=Protea cynaroides TaxID=273540 RepID=A0A9Q0K2Z7_9MAGN|nr:hypothetical protein NE237_021849 [Protea cynaroides]
MELFCLPYVQAKLLGDPISIVYHYGEYTEVKNADPDRYSYVDVIYDVYCGVLKDIPSGKTIKFSIKAVLPNSDESVLKEDKDVVRMFEKSANACDPIHCYVFRLEVNEEVSNVYWVNTFEGNVMQRPKTSVVNSPSRQRTPIKRHNGGGGSKAIEKGIAGSRKVYNLSSSSEAQSLDNDDVDWQQHGEGSDNQNHSKSEGCQSDREDDEVFDGGQSGGCMSGNEGDEDQAILKCVDSNKDIDDKSVGSPKFNNIHTPNVTITEALEEPKMAETITTILSLRVLLQLNWPMLVTESLVIASLVFVPVGVVAPIGPVVGCPTVINIVDAVFVSEFVGIVGHGCGVKLQIESKLVVSFGSIFLGLCGGLLLVSMPLLSVLNISTLGRNNYNGICLYYKFLLLKGTITVELVCIIKPLNLVIEQLEI